MLFSACARICDSFGAQLGVRFPLCFQLVQHLWQVCWTAWSQLFFQVQLFFSVGLVVFGGFVSGRSTWWASKVMFKVWIPRISKVSSSIFGGSCFVWLKNQSIMGGAFTKKNTQYLHLLPVRWQLVVWRCPATGTETTTPRRRQRAKNLHYLCRWQFNWPTFPMKTGPHVVAWRGRSSRKR